VHRTGEKERVREVDYRLFGGRGRKKEKKKGEDEERMDALAHHTENASRDKK